MKKYFLLLFCICSFRAFGQIDTSEGNPEEIYLRFNYANVVDVIITSCYKDNEIYIPVEDIFRSLNINISPSSTGNNITGFLINQDSTYEINYKDRLAEFTGRKIPMEKNEIILFKKTYFVLPSVLKKIFNLEFSVNFNNQTLSLSTSLKIPAILNRERENNRFKLKELRPFYSAPLIYPSGRRWIMLGYMDYNLSATVIRNGNPFFGYDLTAGAHLAKGEFNLSARGGLGKDIDKTPEINYLWKCSIGENKILNQLNLGRQTSMGLFPEPYEGVYVSNLPIKPRVSFGSYIVSDKTIPNSEVELYVNNKLFDYKKSDGLGN
jgi:hypothetical protein